MEATVTVPVWKAKRIWHAALLASTCMSAIAIPVAVRAQTVAPDTTPTGGNVTAGAATITNGTASTTINQTSQRTAINWQTFNVGSNANVTFVQPNSSSVALNRVLTPSPSIIAGHIDANGQLVLVNQSGVVFTKGSEVNAESLVVATSNISDSNFMAGRMVFDGTPRPGAKIVNEGKITVHDTGLVGLIAPQVENRGIITAKLGQVMLAGASAFTLDMYGDRLISIDVTKAVRAVEVDGKLVPALVTNSGLIVADGGKITLTAQDADALVTQLIDAGGTIRANSVGNQAGAIDISGVGGNISIAGNLLATGKTGGTVHVQADAASAVSLSSSAKIDASGATGGGTIALGTSLARAAAGASDKTAAKSGQVLVAPGATLKANAKTNGTGGLITLLSADDTDFAGAIFATGGTLAGNGGAVEISSDGGFQETGAIDVSAPAGAAGNILFDPMLLTVATGGSTTLTGGTVAGNDASDKIDPANFISLTGTVQLSASSSLEVDSAINSSSLASLLLVAPTVTTEAAGVVNLTGTSARLALVADTLSLGATVSASTIELAPFGAPLSSGLLAVGGTGIPTGSLKASALLRLGAYTPFGSTGSLDVTGQGVVLGTGTLSPTALEIDSNGTITQASGNTISVTDLLLDSVGGPITLAGSQTFATLTGAAADGGLLLNDSEALKITGAVTDSSAAPINISATTLDVNSAVAGSSVTLGASAGTLGLAANVSAATALSLSGKAGVVQTAGSLTATTLGAASASGNVQLTGTTNNFGTLAASSANGTFSAADSATNLTIAGAVTAPHISLSAAALSFVTGGTLAPSTELDLATGALNSAAGAISFSATGGTFALAPGAAGGTLSSAEITLATGDIAATNAPTSYILGAADGITAAALTLANPLSLSGDTVELTAASSIALAAGATLTAGTVQLSGTTGTNFSEDSTAEILASLFGIDATGGTFGNVIAPGTANAIGTLSGATAGTLALVDTGALTLAGALNLASLSVSGASTLDVTGSITAASGLTLAATTLVSDNGTLDLTGNQAALLLSAPTVTNSATITASGTGAEIGLVADTLSLGAAVTAANGTIAITPFSANSVIDVGATGAAGTLGLDEAALTSHVSAAELLLGSLDGTAATNTSNILIDGKLGSNGETIGLFATSLVTQTAVLTAGKLIGAADSFALDAANAVGVLGSVSAGSTLSFADGGDLTLAGPLTAANLISLSAAGSLVAGGTLAAPSVTLRGGDFIGLTGSISAGTALDLVSTHSFAQAATAALTVGELDGSVTTGNASFSGTNAVGTIGNFIVAAGDFALSDTGALTVSTALEASNITLAAASLALGGTLSVASFLSLTGTAGISQAAGATLTAPTLALDTATNITTGIVDLGGSNNLVGTLAGARSTGGLTLTDTGALDVTGAVADSSSASSAAISLTATSLTLGSHVSGEAVALDATEGAITQTSAGTLSASTLSATAASGITLANAANDFGVETGLAAGTLSLNVNDAASTLTLAGAVTAGVDVSLAVAALAFGAGGVIMPGRNLALAVDSLGSLADSISFASAASVALAPFTAAGTVAGQVDALLADLTGAAPTSFTIGKADGVTAAAISLSGTDNFGTALVDLVAAGSIAQTAGSLTAGTLELSGTTLTSFTQAAGAAISAATFSGDGATTIGSIAALGTANTIATLGAFLQPSTSSLAFLDTGTLSITNALDLAGVTLSAASTLNLDSSITAATLVIGSSTYVRQGNAGVLNVTTLLTDGKVDGNILLGSANSVSTLGNVALTGSFFLANTPGITLAGTLAGNAVDIRDTGAITEVTGGAIQAATLGAVGTEISLLGPDNSIATIGLSSIDDGITASSGISLNNGANALTFASAVSVTGAGNADFAAGSMVFAANNGGTIAVSGAGAGITLATDNLGANGELKFGAAGGTLALAPQTANGTVKDAAILAGEIAGTAPASIVLGDAVIGATTYAAGTISLTGTTTFGSASADLVAASAITLASGTLAAGTLELGGSAATSFAEGSAATISAATFATDGSTIGNISAYEAGNTIGTLGVIAQTAGSTLAVKTAGALDVSSALSDAVITLNAAGLLTLNADVTATSLTALGGGTVTQAGGTLSSPTLVSDGAIASDVSLALAGNRIGTLGNVTLGGNLTLADTELLNIAGNVTVGGTAGFGGTGVTELAGGALATALLTNAGALGGITLAQATNNIADIGPLSLTGGLTINNGSNALTIGSSSANQSIQATNISLAAPTLSIDALTGAGAGLTATSTGGEIALAADAVSVTGFGLLGGPLQTDHGTLALGPDSVGGPVNLNSPLFTTLGTTQEVILGNSTAGAINIAADQNFGTLTLAFESGSSITQTTGTITAGDLILAATGFTQSSAAAIDAGTLAGASAFTGNFLAPGITNAVGTLASITFATPANSTLTAIDTGALHVAAENAAVITLSAATLSLAGNITATSALTLGAGSVTQTGSITTQVLSSTGTGNFDLGLASNRISTLAAFSGTALTLADSIALTLAGTDSLSAALEFTTLAGGLTEAAAATLDAATLLADTALPGDVTLAGAGNNVIGTLSTLQLTNGTLDLVSTGATTLVGLVSAANITLNTGSLTIDGTLSANNILDFAGGGVSETLAGTVTATTLTGTDTLAGDLLITTASIGTIDSLLASGAFTFVDSRALTLANTLGALGGNATLVAPAIDLLATGQVEGDSVTLAANSAAGGLDFAGSVQAGTLAGDTLALLTLGTIAQHGGGLQGATLTDVGTLFGTTYVTGGTVSLSGATIDIGALGSFVAANLYLGDNTALDVAGNVTATAGGVTLADAPGLTLSGDISVSGSNSIVLSTDTLSLIGASPILTAREIAIAPSTASDIVIGGATDSNSNLAISLAQLALLSNAGTLALGSANGRTASAIYIAGAESVGQTLALSATTLISQTAGTLGAAAIFMSAGSAIDLAGLVTAAGSLGLTGGSIDDTGSLDAGSISLTGTSLTLGSLVTAAGAISLTASTGDVTGPATLHGGTVSITGATVSLASVTATTGLGVTATGAITDASTGTLDAGSISLTGTSLTLGSLVIAAGAISLTATSGTLTGPATLEGGTINVSAASAITLGSLTSAANTIALTATAGDITDDGALTGSDITISGTTIELGGSVSTTGTLALSGSGAVTDNGTVTAGTLSFTNAGFTQSSSAGIITAALFEGTATAGDVRLDALANSITMLGPVTAAGSISLFDGAALTLTAPLSAASDITLDDTAAAGISFTGTAGITAASGHNIRLTANSLSTGATPFTLSAPGGTIALAAINDAIDLGGATVGMLDLANGLIANATASLLLIGDGTSNILADAAVTAANAGALTLDGTNISFAGSLDVPGLLTLQAATLVTQSAGGITAGTLTGSTLTPTIALNGPANNITTLAAFNTGAHDFSLIDTLAPTLSLAGPLTAGAVAISAASVIDPGTITATSLLLSATGSISFSGLITTTSFANISAADITDSGTIQVGTPFTTGNLFLTSTDSLAISGLITNTSFAEISGGTVSDTGAINVGSLSLSGTSGISISGPITASSFADITAPTISLIDSTPTGITTLDAPTVSLTGSATLALGGFISASTLLSLDGHGTVSETGTISTATLALGSLAAASLTGINSFATLAGGSLSGDLAVSDTQNLTQTGSVQAADITVSAPSIGIAGTITAPGILALTGVSAGVSQSSSASIIAGTLTTGGADTGNINLASTTNKLTNLGAVSLSTGGTLTLDDASQLTISGPLNVDAALLTAPGFDVLAGVSVTDLLGLFGGTAALTLASTVTAGTLEIGGASVTEASGGTIIASTLSSNSIIFGDVSLENRNSIGVLGNFAVPNHTLSLNDAGAASGLTVAGTVIASGISISAPAIDLTGALNASTLLALDASAGDLTLGGLASASGLITLAANSSINESGTIDAGTLALSLPSSSTGNATLTGTNAIATLAGATLLNGTLVLSDAQALTIAGSNTAASASLTAPGIDLTGAFTVLGAGQLLLADSAADGMTLSGFAQAGTLNLVSDGLVTETGTLDAQTLTGTAAGDVVLTGAANNIGTLGDYSQPSGNFTLADSAALDLTGSVSSSGALDLAAGSISFAGTVNAATLALSGPAGVATQTGGSITAQTLTTDGATLGLVILQNGTNRIDTLSGFNSTVDLFLFDIDNGTAHSSLVIAGTNAITGGILAASSITLAGSLSGLDFAIEGGVGGVTETSDGALNIATLDSGSAIEGGNFELTSNNNTIQTIASLVFNTTAGTFDLGVGDSIPLSIIGPVSANNISLSAPDLTITTQGAVSALQSATLAGSNHIEIDGGAAAGGILSLASGGGIDEAGSGNVVAATLTGTGSSISLTSGLNSIGTLSGLASAGALAVTDGTGAMAVTNLVSAASAALIASSFDILGTLATTGALSLTAFNGGIDDSAGAIDAATLSGAVSGGDALLTGTNLIATLGSFAAGTNSLDLADATALALTGPVTAANVTLGGSNIALNGVLSASSALDLVSTGTITEGSTASLTAATLTSDGNTDGAVTLASGTNNFGALSSFAAANLFLVDQSPLSVGNVSVTFITLAATSGLTFVNNVRAAGQLILNVPGTVAQTGGVITAGTLLSTGATTGTVTLLDANAIGTLGAFSAASLALNDAGTLAVAGPVNAANIALSGSSLLLAGNVAGTVLTLAASGDITQTAGSLAVGTLRSGGVIGGNAALTQANAVGTIGNFAAAGNLSLTDAATLATAGTQSAATITLTAGALTAASTMNAAGNLILTALTGALSTAGAESAAAAIVLTAAGAINDAATQTAANITATATGTLSTAGAETAANAIVLKGAGITLGSALNAGKLELLSSNGVSQTAAITAQTLTTNGTTITGNAALGQTANSIGTLTNFAATGDLTLADAAPLTITGAVTTGGAFGLGALAGATQTGGSISAATLTSDGQTDGTVTLGQSANTVPVLGNFADSGNLTLADADALTLAGNITGQTINLPLAGALTQASGALTAAVLNASAPSIALTDAANAIAALGSVTTGNLAVNGLASITGPVSASSATLTTAGNFALSGNAALTNALDIVAAGTITQTAGSLSAATETLSAAAITLSGTDTVSGNLSLSTAGDIIHNAGTLDAATLTGDAGTLASFVASTDFGTIGSFIMNDSVFSLTNTGALTITGPLVANVISIATTGALTLAGSTNGGLFIAGPVENNTVSSIAKTDSVLETNGAPITATNQFNINAGTSSGLFATNLASSSNGGTLFLLTAASPTDTGANITFNATAPNGINAPGIDLILDSGTAGAMTGYVNVAHLEVLGGQQSYLLGYVAGDTGEAAAGKASASPIPLSKYQINACPIGSLNCVILNVEAIPTSNPLQNFDITQQKKRRLGRNVQLPGVATHDF